MDNNKIKMLIISKGYKQRWVAEQIGVTNTTISLWATNKAQPSASSLMKLMSVLECTPEDIYG
jgi:DNA-binding XRE family transcriptional regulator